MGESNGRRQDLPSSEEAACRLRELDALRALIDADDQPVFSLDRELRYTAFNRAHADAMRALYGAEIALGARLSDYQTIAADRKTSEANLERALAGERVTASAFSAEGAQRRFFEIVHVPQTDANGAIVGVAVRAHDVTERLHAEAALGENRALLASVIKGTSDAVYVKDTSGRYLLFNAAAELITGKTAADVLGKDDRFLFPADEAAVVMEADRTVMAQTEPLTFEETVTDAAGRLATFLSTKGPIYDEHGALLGLFGVARDITERKAAEVALGLSEARYAKAQAVGRVGSWEYDVKTTRFWGSDEAKRIFGFDQEMETFSTEEVEAITPERDLVHQALVDLISEGKPFDLEYEIRPKSSSEPCIIWSVAELRRDERGEPLTVTGVIHDITRRRKAEDARRESESRYRSLFEDSPVAMWEEDDSAVKAHLEGLAAAGVTDVIAYVLADPQEYAHCVALTRNIDANKAAVRLFEAESREVLMARNSDLYRRESNRGVYRLWEAMLAGERSVTFEEANLTLLGREVQILETCTVVPGHEQTYDRVYVADIDITERKLAEERLRENEANLEVILEATADGILAVDISGRVRRANRRFAELWRIPDALLESGDDEALLAFVHDQLADPDAFLRGVRALYKSDATVVDTLLLRDGRVFERHSSATMKGSAVTGRVWSFSDVSEQVHAKTELVERERVLSTLMGNLPGMAYRCANDRKWTMQFVSAGCEALTGYAPDALVGNQVVAYGDLVLHADVEKLREDVAVATNRGEPWTCVYRIVTAAGELKWVWERGVAVKDASGRVLLLEGFIQDVTAQRAAEELLEAASVEWRRTFDAMRDSVAVFDREGRLQRCNLATTKLTGRDFDDLIGRQCYEVFHGTSGYHENCPQLRASASGQPETSILEQDGHWLRVTFEPRVDEAGHVCGGVHVVSDVTELKQATAALEQSAVLLTQGERLAHLGSWRWNIAEGISIVSEEWQRMHGMVGDQFSDEEILRNCHEDDREAMQAAKEKTAAGAPYLVDHRIVRPDTHEVRHLTTYGEPLFDREGHLETVIGASLDVTERVEADRVLRESEERARRALGDTVAALGATVAMRDPYTASHERRVCELACLIAARQGRSEEEIEILRSAALVHDVGKISVPAEILSKPTRLTETEFALIKNHSAAAYEILAPIDFGGPVAEIVHQHHERLDGSGYPQGLSAEEILPEARILAVADVVEAMISHRPYRAALPLEEALAEIGPNSLGRFDAESAEVCRKLFQEEGFRLAE
jgi:PAS domain S-box-containing protein